MPAKINAKFAESDAYISQLMREVRDVPAEGAFPMGRRTFFKLAGAGTAGLVLGFHLPGEAFAAEAPQGGKAQIGGRHGSRPAQLLDIGGDVHALDRGARRCGVCAGCECWR